MQIYASHVSVSAADYADYSFGRSQIAIVRLHKSIWPLCASGYCRQKRRQQQQCNSDCVLVTAAAAAADACHRILLNIWPVGSYPESVFKANFICNTICTATVPHTHRAATFLHFHLQISHSMSQTASTRNRGEGSVWRLIRAREIKTILLVSLVCMHRTHKGHKKLFECSLSLFLLCTMQTHQMKISYLISGWGLYSVLLF